MNRKNVSKGHVYRRRQLPGFTVYTLMEMLTLNTETKELINLCHFAFKVCSDMAQ